MYEQEFDNLNIYVKNTEEEINKKFDALADEEFEKRSFSGFLFFLCLAFTKICVFGVFGCFLLQRIVFQKFS